MTETGRQRIQKYLSSQGICSRRTAEQWIRAGLVFINGVPARIGTQIDPGKDTVTFARGATHYKQYQYYLFNKPRGIVTVNARENEKEIKDCLRLPRGVVPVGRLDKDSRGLILLTNDGVVARRLMDPAFEHEKEYEVAFYKAISDSALEKIAEGQYLFGQKTKPIRLSRITPLCVHMILTEGKNRQIRRLSEKVGYPVKDIKRIRLVCFSLDTLPEGKARTLHDGEIKKLYSVLHIRH